MHCIHHFSYNIWFSLIFLICKMRNITHLRCFKICVFLKNNFISFALFWKKNIKIVHYLFFVKMLFSNQILFKTNVKNLFKGKIPNSIKVQFKKKIRKCVKFLFLNQIFPPCCYIQISPSTIYYAWRSQFRWSTANRWGISCPLFNSYYKKKMFCSSRNAMFLTVSFLFFMLSWSLFELNLNE